ncbi:hypothetical protein B0T16DRAFT_304673, partial [Cercophora newfieldiana]
ACVQCTRSKRKCDKTAPQCKRCVERGDSCDYQPLAHIHRNAAALEDNSKARAESDSNEESPVNLPSEATAEAQPSISTSTNTSTIDPLASTLPPLNFNHLSLSFLHPDSWRRSYGLDPLDEGPQSRISEEDLPLYISHLKRWMQTWLSEGHCPMMHRHLYRGHMPECIQDAFTALAAYNGATTHTKCSVLRIIRDRADRLISSQPAPINLDLTSDPNPDANGPESSAFSAPCVILDTPTHLARTQALFVYQLIRLFDADIRSRAQAEEQMGTLHTWATQMLESARLDCVTAEYLMNASDSPNIPGGGTNPNNFTLVLNTAAMTDPSLTWQAWILAESVRRVFLMAEYMQSVYLTIKRGWSVCSGGVAFTPKAGLWDAQEAWAWANK